MSQTWTDDTYAGSHVAATDLQNIENNFAALKTSFSGTSAPPSPKAGQLWLDTSNSLLKLYDGSSWQAVWDYANNRLPSGAVAHSGAFASGVVGEAAIGSGAVTSSKIGSGAVTSSNIGSGAVGTSAIANGAVTNAKIGNGEVDAPKLAPGLTGPAIIGVNWDDSNTGWQTAIRVPIYVPSSARYARLAASVNGYAGSTMWVRLTVGSVTLYTRNVTCSGDTLLQPQQSYSVSGLSGWYHGTVDVYCSMSVQHTLYSCSLLWWT